MKISQTKPVPVDVKIVKVHAKCCDMCSIELIDSDGQLVKEHDGYVPSFMPGEHFGDYLILDIDIETGQILNWSKAKVEAKLEEFINQTDE